MTHHATPRPTLERDRSPQIRRAAAIAAVAATIVVGPLACESDPEPVTSLSTASPAAPSTISRDAANTAGPTRPAMPFAEGFSTGPVASSPPQEATNSTVAVASAEDVERDLRRLSSLATTGDFMPDVARDGSFVAFASRQQRSDFDLYRRSLLGRDVAPLVTMPGDQIMPALSPDGRFVAFASDSDGNWNVFIAPVEGGTPIRLAATDADEVHPTWSPDGTELAFARRGGHGAWDVWTVEASGRGEASIVAAGFLPRWSPVETAAGGRSTILVQRAGDRGSSRWGLWALDVEGSRLVGERPLVVARNAATIQACWSPDAERIAFVTVVDVSGGDDPQASDLRSDLWTARSDGSDRRLLTSGVARSMQPAWLRGRGGDRILFVTDRGGADALWSLRPPAPGESRDRLADGQGQPD